MDIRPVPGVPSPPTALLKEKDLHGGIRARIWRMKSCIVSFRKKQGAWSREQGANQNYSVFYSV